MSEYWRVAVRSLVTNAILAGCTSSAQMSSHPDVVDDVVDDVVGRSRGVSKAEMGLDGSTSPKIAMRDDASSGQTSSGSDVVSDSREGYCTGSGPPIMVGDSDGGVTASMCTGTITARIFNQSVCTCTDANIVGYVHTSSFHSGKMQSETASGGPVGVNQAFNSGGAVDIGGTF